MGRHIMLGPAGGFRQSKGREPKTYGLWTLHGASAKERENSLGMEVMAIITMAVDVMCVVLRGRQSKGGGRNATTKNTKRNTTRHTKSKC